MLKTNPISRITRSGLHLFVLGFILIGCGCENTKTVQAQNRGSDPAAETARIEPPAPGLPYIGFNAKGDMNTSEQVAMTDDLLETLPASVKSKLAIRVTAGTRSQKIFMEDWTDQRVSLWADLQKKHGIRLIYVVNGTDTPENQGQVIRKFMDAGVTFDFLEMMNEYYLRKFRKGKTERAEVTRKITVRDYIDEILPRYWKELDAFNLPYYLIYAPMKPHASDKTREYFQNWNRTVNEALNGKYADRDLHAVLHLYRRGPESYDYDQIGRLRNQMPEGRHIAVTEAGILDKNIDYKTKADQTISHYAEIFKRLGQGDYLLDQVLYTNYKDDDAATLHPDYANKGGLTPKGEKVMEFIRSKYIEGN